MLTVKVRVDRLADVHAFRFGSNKTDKPCPLLEEVLIKLGLNI
jgi:hypothetical protein